MKNLLLFSFLALFVMSCSDDDDTVIENTVQELEIPETYSFENVDYSGQTQRLSMLLEMKSYLSSANAGATLEAENLQKMFDNTFTAWEGTYEDSKQIKNKTYEPEQAVFESLFTAMAENSTSDTTGSEGVAGVIASEDGAKKYLFNEKGLEFAQIIEKGLMGACFYYQATTVYLGPDKMEVDNATVTPGKGTAMEHHWDEAFGYLGAPTTFPTTTDGVFFWAHYSNVVNGQLGTNKMVMDALLKGRAAISAKNMDKRDEAITEVRNAWELVSAGTAIHYINSTMRNEGDISLRNHALSEAIAFTYSLKFNSGKRVSDMLIDDVLAKIGGGTTDFMQMDLYAVTNEDLTSARDLLADALNISDAVKTQL